MSGRLSEINMQSSSRLLGSWLTLEYIHLRYLSQLVPESGSQATGLGTSPLWAVGRSVSRTKVLSEAGTGLLIAVSTVAPVPAPPEF